MFDYSKDLMKSKLAIIVALTSIACIGIPLQAEETEITRRGYAIVDFVYARCWLEKGLATQEQLDDARRETLKRHPDKKAAFEWAKTSPNGKAAIHALMTYVDDNCDINITTDEQFMELIGPYAK